MRAMYRTVTAVALGLPLLVAGPAVASASTLGTCCSREHHKVDVDVDQDNSQTANQNNNNGPTKVRGDHNNVVNVQENESAQSSTQDASSER